MNCLLLTHMTEWIWCKAKIYHICNYLYCIVFIHFYSASLSMNHSEVRLHHSYCVGVNPPKRYGQLRLKDLPEVLTWRLEWDSNMRPSGRKAQNLTTTPQTLADLKYLGCNPLKIKWLTNFLNCSSL